MKEIMRITLPTTFEKSYADSIAEINSKRDMEDNQIAEFYGSMQTSVLGSARPSKYLPTLSYIELKKHIEYIESLGIDFSYLANAPCLGNIEYSGNGRLEIESFLSRLSDAGVKRMIITIPYLMEIVREKFPHIKIAASSICYISNLKIAKRFEELGIERIVIDPDKNRDFKTLKKICSSVSAEIEVIANHTCIHHCSYEYYHYNNTGHGSQKFNGEAEKPYNQYNLLACTLKKLESPWEFLASPWIRPEDTDFLADAGVKWIKIAGRGSSPEALLELAGAYVKKAYKGNLIPFLGWCHWNSFRKTEEGNTLPSLEIKLDPSKLNGFMDKFRNGYCCDDGCDTCDYCKKTALEAITYDSELIKLYGAELASRIAKITKSVFATYAHYNQEERIPKLKVIK